MSNHRPAYVSLSDRLRELGEGYRRDLDAIRLGDPFDRDRATVLVDKGLAQYIGGEPFITETGRRALSIWS